MAHKKAAGSTKNLRDSKPKYRGVKLFWWEEVRAWGIIIKQKWSKYNPWSNVYVWKDFSLHSKIDWIVSFRRRKFKRFDWRKYLKTVVDVNEK